MKDIHQNKVLGTTLEIPKPNLKLGLLLILLIDSLPHFIAIIIRNHQPAFHELIKT